MRHCRPWLLQKHITRPATLALSIKSEQVLLLCVSATPSSLCRPSTRASGGLKKGAEWRDASFRGVSSMFRLFEARRKDQQASRDQSDIWSCCLVRVLLAMTVSAYTHGMVERCMSKILSIAIHHVYIIYSYSSLHIISLSLDMLAYLASHHLWIKWYIYDLCACSAKNTVLASKLLQSLGSIISARLPSTIVGQIYLPQGSASLGVWGCMSPNQVCTFDSLDIKTSTMTSQETSSDSRRLRSGIESILRDQEALNQCCVLLVLGFLDHNFGEFEFAASVAGPTRGNSGCHGRHPFFSQSLRAIWWAF